MFALLMNCKFLSHPGWCEL